MRAIDTAGTYLAQEPEQTQPATVRVDVPAPAADLQADLNTQVDQFPIVNLKADRGAKLNLIPAAADATKKESKIRNISTKWSSITFKADSQRPMEAKK
jgi:hypothetical protein